GRKLKVRLKDGRVHEARILYKPPWMSVSLDGGEPEVRVPVDLRTVADESGLGILCFTASTGNGYENHDILTWNFTPTAVDSNVSMVRLDISYLRTICLEDHNLCTPAEAQVQETGPGQYHV